MKHLAFALFLLSASAAEAGLAFATLESPGVLYPGHGSLTDEATPVTITLVLNNGGSSSLANQTWGPDNLVSFRLDVDFSVGHSYTYLSHEVDASSWGSFTTDASGALLPGTIGWSSPFPDVNAVNTFRSPTSETTESLGEGWWTLTDFLHGGGYPVVLTTGGSYAGSIATNPSVTTNWTITAIPEASQVLCLSCLALVAAGRFALSRVWR